ncbi:hypothetical protein QR680_014123 [Steinernema hermaphroditum]|uniref:Uncharacterized protein n=1 Tax=Steinernema hermaphroditum TaxID=289476 RepID=A0AA39IA25_9BILA|nr:hypothetical protein QR680_014123 [Steinernema hermaphroditum]
MDTVPYNFVDAVIDLFPQRTLKRPLAENVNNTIWKDVIQLHYYNRRYFNVYIAEVDDRFQIVFEREGSPERATIQELRQVAGRYLRFIRVCNSYGEDEDDKVLYLQKDDQKTLRQMLSPAFAVSGARLSIGRTSGAAQKWIMEGLFKKIYFHELNVPYIETIAEEFLKDQIEKSPVLRGINLLHDGPWPLSILPYLKKFLLQTGMKSRTFKQCGSHRINVEKKLDTAYKPRKP